MAECVVNGEWRMASACPRQYEYRLRSSSTDYEYRSTSIAFIFKRRRGARAHSRTHPGMVSIPVQMYRKGRLHGQVMDLVLLEPGFLCADSVSGGPRTFSL